MDALAQRQSRPSVQQSELAGIGYQSHRGSKSHLPPHSWYACTYRAAHRHLPAASWNPEGKLSSAAWNISWHAKLLTQTKWGPWEGTQLCQLHTTARAAHHPWRTNGGLCIHLPWPPTPSRSSPHGAPPGCWCLLLSWPLTSLTKPFQQQVECSATLQTGEHGTGHLEKASDC